MEAFLLPPIMTASGFLPNVHAQREHRVVLGITLCTALLGLYGVAAGITQRSASRIFPVKKARVRSLEHERGRERTELARPESLVVEGQALVHLLEGSIKDTL